MIPAQRTGGSIESSDFDRLACCVMEEMKLMNAGCGVRHWELSSCLPTLFQLTKASWIFDRGPEIIACKLFSPLHLTTSSPAADAKRQHHSLLITRRTLYNQNLLLYYHCPATAVLSDSCAPRIPSLQNPSTTTGPFEALAILSPLVARVKMNA